MTEEAQAEAPEAPAEAPQEAAQSEQPSATTAEALDKAFAAVEAQDAEPAPDKVKAEQPPKAEPSQKTEAKPDAEPKDAQTGERERNPDGTFKAKEPEGEKPAETKADTKPQDPTKTAVDAPERFTAEAKAAWRDAPEPVKAEVRRLEQELSAGMEKYKGDAEAFAEFKPFAEQLKANGQRFDDVLNHYVGMEQLLAKDPIAGFEKIARNLGTDFQTLAGHYLNRAPDEVSQAHNSQITSMHNEIADLKRQLSGVTTQISTQQENDTLKQIQEFSADKPRFDELSPDIQIFLETGRAKDLAEAYDLAERLNPAPQAPAIPAGNPATPAAQPRDPSADTAQTRKGQLSVNGAPGDGSNPTSRKVPETARAALDNAFAQVGLG